MYRLEEILKIAYENGASDLHIRSGAEPLMRVSGALLPVGMAKFTAADTLELLISVLSETERNTFEEQGDYETAYEAEGLCRCRLRIYKAKSGAAIAARLIPFTAPRLASLSYTEEEKKGLCAICEKRTGLVLLTGGAGTGRSTLLAALLTEISRLRAANIMTLEKPIEYVLENDRSTITQRELNVDTRDRESALQSALRGDADVLAFADVNDAVSVENALLFAEAGRLAFAVTEAGSLTDAVGRLLDYFPAHRQALCKKRLTGALAAAALCKRDVLYEKGDGAEAEKAQARYSCEIFLPPAKPAPK